jgi:hypothetical protein
MEKPLRYLRAGDVDSREAVAIPVSPERERKREAMGRLQIGLPLAFVLLSLAFGPIHRTAQAQDAKAQVAERAQAFLKKYCYDCHGGPGDQGTRLTNVLDLKVLLAKPDNPKKKPFVLASDFQNSLLWIMAATSPFRMPPDDAETKPGDDERTILEAWISPPGRGGQ